jgi:hypothetical protein
VRGVAEARWRGSEARGTGVHVRCAATAARDSEREGDGEASGGAVG